MELISFCNVYERRYKHELSRDEIADNHLNVDDHVTQMQEKRFWLKVRIEIFFILIINHNMIIAFWDVSPR